MNSIHDKGSNARRAKFVFGCFAASLGGNLEESLRLKGIKLGGAPKILNLISCATYIFQEIHGQHLIN